MNWVMLANAIIEVAWICATVYLVTTGHHYWAVATFVATFMSGYKATTTTKKSK